MPGSRPCTGRDASPVCVLIEADPAARGAPDAIRALDEQVRLDTVIQATVLQSTADLSDSVQTDSLEAIARETTLAA